MASPVALARLAVIFVLALGVSGFSSWQVIPKYSSTIYDSVRTNSDGSVQIVAEVYGGRPAADEFSWKLPNGRSIEPGQSYGNYEASPPQRYSNGRQRFALVLKNGYLSTPQTIIFTASATSRWSKNFTFKLPAKSTAITVPRNDVYSTLTTNTEYSRDGPITLQVTVAGGSPSPDRFHWTLPNGATLSPGRTSGTFQATSVRHSYGDRTHYKLYMRNGLTSSEQKITFTAKATGRWWRNTTVTFKPKTAVDVSLPGSVRSSISRSSYGGNTKITAEIIGGKPKPNTYEWTFQQADGSTITLKPGQSLSTGGGLAELTTNSRGNPSTTLTVPYTSDRTRVIRLYVASKSGGRSKWQATRTWRITATRNSWQNGYRNSYRNSYRID